MKTSLKQNALFVLIVMLIAITFAQEVNATKKKYQDLTNTEITRLNIEDLAALDFTSLIALSDRFTYPSAQVQSECELVKSNIEIPIEILADLSFEELMLVTNKIDIRSNDLISSNSCNVSLPLYALAELDLIALDKLTTAYSNIKLMNSQSIQMNAEENYTATIQEIQKRTQH